MVFSVARRRRSVPARLAGLLSLLAWLGSTLLTASVVGAAQSSPRFPADFERIRTIDVRLAELVQWGLDLSPTLRRLAGTIERSDLIVYVERHSRFREGEAGSFRVVGSYGGQRYVRIALNAVHSDRELVVALAHEIQHAVEVASVAHVMDEKTLHELYCRIGEVRAFGYDTVAARDVTRQVSAELSATVDR